MENIAPCLLDHGVSQARHQSEAGSKNSSVVSLKTEVTAPLKQFTFTGLQAVTVFVSEVLVQ
jgi:hypothetical protein